MNPMYDLHHVNEIKYFLKPLLGTNEIYDFSAISYSTSIKINDLLSHCKVCINYDCLRCTLRGIITQSNIILDKNIGQLTTSDELKMIYIIEELETILKTTAGGSSNKDNTTCIFYNYAKKCTQVYNEVPTIYDFNEPSLYDEKENSTDKILTIEAKAINADNLLLPVVSNWEMLDNLLLDHRADTDTETADDLYT